MKRYTGPVFALSLLLVLCFTATSVATEYPKPWGVYNVQMQKGWYQGGQAWYTTLATNDAIFARYYYLTLVPNLSSVFADAGGAAKLYWVTNYNNGGIVFSTGPGSILYSGLWDVQFVTWKPGVTPWVITRTDVVGAQPGLPDATQADTLDSNTVLDYPILALGPLGGPWLPAPAGSYRIPQAIPLPGYQYSKVVKLPMFEVFCTDQIHRRVQTERTLIITDVTDSGLATALGANLAPALLDVDSANRQAFWFIEGGPYNCQKPVLEFCLTWPGTLAAEYDYSPVMDFIRLGRSPSLPPQTTVNNPNFLNYLLTVGLLNEISDGVVINANITPDRVNNGNSH